MKTFKDHLKNKIQTSLYNNFGAENFDAQRFGTYLEESKPVTQILKEKVKKIIKYKINSNTQSEILKIKDYEDRLEYMWSNLNEKSQQLLIDIIAYRLLGYKKIKLPLSNLSYRKMIDKVQSLKKSNETIDTHFNNFILELFDLRKLGYDVEMFFLAEGIVIDFIIEQYAYKLNDDYILQAEKGDVVLDVGACWGDTALYFANKVGDQGKVFSFEFIPENIKIYKRNVQLNPQFRNIINLIENPVSEISDQGIYFEDNGPGSYISSSPFKTQTGNTSTISIDDFVIKYNLSKVDFIKMDIEGAELPALKGAINTIKKFKPKLAIAIYHSMDDLVNIPNWLIDLNIGYDFFLDHYTIHQEETVIYAKPKH